MFYQIQDCRDRLESLTDDLNEELEELNEGVRKTEPWKTQEKYSEASYDAVDELDSVIRNLKPLI